MMWLRRVQLRRHGFIGRSLSNLAATQELKRSSYEGQRVLWVSYSDPQTVRRRLVGVAQQVLGLLNDSQTYNNQLPELIIPNDARRTRHGFWFMRFSEVDQMMAAQKELNKSESC